MLSDVVTSEGHRKMFAEKKPNNPIEVLVCSSTWPNLVANPNAKMPPEMKAYTTEFEHFYKQLPMYQSKVLAWILSEGKGEMFAHFAKMKYILDVKTYQISILLRFNENSEYTYEKLKELTGINDDILNEYLKVFTVQVPLMKRSPNAKKVIDWNWEKRVKPKYIGWKFQSKRSYLSKPWLQERQKKDPLFLGQESKVSSWKDWYCGVRTSTKTTWSRKRASTRCHDC